MAERMKLAALLLVPVALSGNASAGEGLELAEQYCQPCHAIGADDTSAHPDAPPFRVVFERHEPEMLAEALAEGIVVGHPDMPEFALPPSEIDALLRYFDTLRQ